MKYALEISPSCLSDIRKKCKKNKVLGEIIGRKINEITENPYHFKPLKNELFGMRRVHVLKSFVLIYEVVEEERKVVILSFEHHDDAYGK